MWYKPHTKTYKTKQQKKQPINTKILDFFQYTIFSYLTHKPETKQNILAI